jgi:uncharacterized protein with ATP-grasp and redox domains
MTDDVRALPPLIMTSEPGSFAWQVIHTRQPRLLDEALRQNDFPEAIRHDVLSLRRELTNGYIRGLNEDAPDRAFWDEAVLPYRGRSWFEVPFLWGEAFFYRRLLEATRYFQPGDWQGIDPFRARKQDELAQPVARQLVETTLNAASDDLTQQFALVVQGSLWGNQADLSFRYHQASQTGGEPEATPAPPSENEHVLIDQSAQLWQAVQATDCRRVALIADNVGSELLLDLVLCDFLLERGIVEQVTLHLKPQPFFISDAMPQDVDDSLLLLEQSGGVLANLAARLRVQSETGQLVQQTHWFYPTPLSYAQLPADLAAQLAEADMVILKGDLNYRRLAGDRFWPHTTPFEGVAASFPAPLVLLRTIKSEVMLGLDEATIERVQQADPDWLVSGQWSVIQGRFSRPDAAE